MPKLDLSAFEALLEQGNNFEVTEEQYENSVRKAMPKTDYLKKNPLWQNWQKNTAIKFR